MKRNLESFADPVEPCAGKDSDVGLMGICVTPVPGLPYCYSHDTWREGWQPGDGGVTWGHQV